MDLSGTEYVYRCTETGVEVIESDGDQQQVTPATWRTETGRWVLGEPYTEPLDAPGDPLEPLAFDCQDHAERAVQVDESGPGGVHPQDSGTYQHFTYGSPR